MSSRKQFEKFLLSVDLAKYRTKYKDIKIVEMDLAKNVQALDLLYTMYWKERKFLSFEQFYARYTKEKKENLEIFRKKIHMCGACFYKGLPARIYRTWASILTQIQAGYVAETMFGSGSVEMSEVLDRKGADIRLTYKNHYFNFQVKKESFSREVRQGKRGKKKLGGRWVAVTYYVPKLEDLIRPKKRNGDLKKSIKKFQKDKRLKCMRNGFVIFKNLLFEGIKKR